MNEKTLIVAIIVVCLSLLLGGCNDKPATQVDNSTIGYEVTDFQGYTIKLSQKPTRIVSMTLGTDEMLVNLVPIERIAALTYLADDGGISSITEQAQKVSMKIRDNAESVIALKPDLVIASAWLRPEIIQTIRSAGINVYVYKTPDTVEDIRQAVLDIAHVVGEDEAGKRLASIMDDELNKVKTVVSNIPEDKRQRLVLLSFMGSYGGKDCLFDNMCKHAGVINGAAEAGVGKNEMLSKEKIVSINPDFMLVPTWDYGGKKDVIRYKEEVQNDPALQPVKAIREHRLIQVSDQYLYCVSHYIVYGVRDIAKAAYPEYFK